MMVIPRARPVGHTEEDPCQRRSPPIRDLKGNILGLKPSQKKNLQKLFQKRIPPDRVLTPELARALTEVSRETGRQIGILVDRRGNVLEVYVGDAKGIVISELSRFRVGKARFRGVRFLHTHLDGEPLTHDDLTDLALLRFDLLGALQALPSGFPGNLHLAWLRPERTEGDPWHLEEPVSVHELDLDFAALMAGLEQESAAATRDSSRVAGTTRKGILVGVTSGRLEDLQQSMAELQELADSAGIQVVEVVTQRRRERNPRYVVGSGKLKELMITAMQKGADLIVFEGELSGSQMRSISELGELEVIDRTQLILDIFARRAHSRDGKLQVELAQMKYSLPRLVLKDDFLSRLTGGIGARGPGETKIEVLRRRVRDRIARLEKELEQLSRQRRLRRSRRSRSGIPVVNLVGYTNAGKSTLLRTLTGAEVLVEDRLFATLDPTSRRLRLPSGREVILTDTVGFIQDLPEDLARAFKATLEELDDADLLVHVVDVSNPNHPDQILAVQGILEDLALDGIPQILLLNKVDQMAPELIQTALETWTGAVPVSALTAKTLAPFLEAVDSGLKIVDRALAGSSASV
jgi:GTP-binding protein HflX